jgi:hypothetical protein
MSDSENSTWDNEPNTGSKYFDDEDDRKNDDEKVESIFKQPIIGSLRKKRLHQQKTT